jgi:hypothetical protein
MKVHENPSSGNRVVTRRRTDRQKDRQTDGQAVGKKEGGTDIHYEVNSRLSKFLQRSYKQRRNWGTSVMTEKLVKYGLTGVTRAPVPENLSSLATCCVNLHIQL